MEKDLESIVMLIDADNTRPGRLEAIIREISANGRIVVKRAYGNWKKENLKNWEDELKRLAINAIQQFDYVAGKNATDMAMVIDAMDLLYRNIYDAFVIVASDSDYTPLAIKLHESGVYVMGVGEKKTPEAFRNACDEFIYLENLDMDSDKKAPDIPSLETAADEIIPQASVSASSPHAAAVKDGQTPSVRSGSDLKEIHSLLKIAYNKYQDEEGFAKVSAAGSFIRRAKPDFDSRTYGYVKFSQLIEAFPKKYEVIKQKGKGSSSILSYRCR
jgi:uncharacterized protein (TIGR00288 family)